MVPTKMYKSVIIGCGSISHNHANGIKKSDATLVAACDVNSDTLAEFCKKYDCAAYSDYKKMISEQKPDAVHICLPHFLHYEAAIYAHQSGAAVFLEKPPAMTKSEFGSLPKDRITVSFQNRYNSSTAKALEIIRSGELGALIGANASVTWNRYGAYYTKSDWRGTQKTEGGSLLINQAIHTLDLLCYIFGKPTRVKSIISNLDHCEIDTEDTACAVIDFDGRRATFFATTCAATSPPATITLLFENGRVTFDSKCLTVSGAKNESFDFSKNIIGKECWGNAHDVIIDKFYKYLGGGENPCSLQSCENTMNLLFEIYNGGLK